MSPFASLFILVLAGCLIEGMVPGTKRFLPGSMDFQLVTIEKEICQLMKSDPVKYPCPSACETVLHNHRYSANMILLACDAVCRSLTQPGHAGIC